MSHTLTLKEPITTTFKSSDGAQRQETITELTLRKPKAKDLLSLDTVTGDVSKTLALISALSGHPMLVIHELSTDDLTAAGEIIAGFFPNGQKTGTTS